MPDGKVQVRRERLGRKGITAEPAAWTIEKIDPIGNREGAPGIFAVAQFGLYLDNLKLTAN